MTPGDYYFNDTFTNDSQKNIIIAGGNSSVVRIFVKKDVTFGYASGINANGSANQLLFYANKSMDIKEEVNISGFLYSKKKISLLGTSPI